MTRFLDVSTFRLALGLAACLAALSSRVQAHQVWIEPTAQGAAQLCFGEFRMNLREDSPGLFDRLPPPAVLLETKDGVTPVTATKGVESYVLAARPTKGTSLLAQDANYPVRESRDEVGVNGRMAWIPAARYVPDLAARTPRLDLDIVPTGSPGEFKVFLGKDAVPKAKVEVIAESGWSRELRTDTDGVLRLSMPWRGRYLLLTHFNDLTPGERAGKPYDFVTYTTTLYFEQAEGIAPVPAPPKAKPSM